MLVTINTDAAWHSGFKVGAFAFWIVCNHGRLSHSGAFKEKCINSTEAEMKCIINAIHTFNAQEWDGVTKIVINTDSKNAIAILTNNIAEIRRYKLQYGSYLRGQFNKIKPKLLTIEFRHVKAHKSKESKKEWVNDWCDKNAKIMLWQQINSKK